MSTVLATQISQNSPGFITALPHVSEVWTALSLPEARLFKKMPALPSAVAADAVPDRPRGTRGNTSSCGTKRNPEHTAPLQRSLNTLQGHIQQEENVGCRL